MSEIQGPYILNLKQHGRQFGSAEGIITVPFDFDEPLDEFAPYMYPDDEPSEICMIEQKVVPDTAVREYRLTLTVGFPANMTDVAVMDALNPALEALGVTPYTFQATPATEKVVPDTPAYDDAAEHRQGLYESVADDMRRGQVDPRPHAQNIKNVIDTATAAANGLKNKRERDVAKEAYASGVRRAISGD